MRLWQVLSGVTISNTGVLSLGKFYAVCLPDPPRQSSSAYAYDPDDGGKFSTVLKTADGQILATYVWYAEKASTLWEIDRYKVVGGPSAINPLAPGDYVLEFASVDERQHRFQPEGMAKLSAQDVPRLKLKWAFGFPGVGQAYAQPAVAAGRVFVGSASRKVYSLDAETGCVYWTFEPDAPVRTAISVGRAAGAWVVFFGDQRANAYAVEADTGKLVWKQHLDDHRAAIVTGAPTLAGGKLYVP